jgi:hypothetical protein
MHQQLCIALAKRMGQTITPAMAVELVRELLPDRSIDPARFGQRSSGRLTFQAERFEGLVDEIHPLHEAHWLETEGYRHGLALNMDYDAMIESERAGAMVQFTARDGARLIGNFRVYLGQSRHTQTGIATEDTIYLLPEYRAGRNCLRFMEFVRDCVTALGYRELRCSTKIGAQTDRLLLHLGFKHVSYGYAAFLV